MGSGPGFGGSGGQSAVNLNADAMGGSGGMAGSFSSQRVGGGFLARADQAAAKQDPSPQFERLDINNNSMRQASFGAAAQGGSGGGGGDRDWMNFASN